MTADTVGGVITYATDLMRALDAEVVLATCGQVPGPQHHRELKLEWMDDPWDDLARAEEWLLDLEQSERPDVVHLNGYAHGAAPFSAPTLVMGHSCVLSWWRAVRGSDAPPTWSRYRDLVRRGLCGADAVTAPTGFLAGELERLYGPLAAPVHVIRNGSDVPLHDWPKERLVLAAGRMWDEAKNLAALAAAEPLVRAAVVIAGDGSSLGRLPREQLDLLRRRAAVFAAPAWYEPFGLAILEAARAGCSLVLGDIPSLRELWEGAARFVDPGDPEALAAAINDALDDPWPAVGHAERYALEATARAHEHLYDDLVQAASRT